MKQYKVYRLQEPEEWGMTVHILSGESWVEIMEEITADIIPLFDDQIPNAVVFWEKTFVEYLGESYVRSVDPTEWAYKPPITRREVVNGIASWVTCFGQKGKN